MSVAPVAPAGVLLGCALLAATVVGTSASAAPSRLQQHPRDVRINESTRRDSAALVSLADARARGERVHTDFDVEWRNDFFKARPGTFVPFTISFPASALPDGPGLLYIRVDASRPAASRPTRKPIAYAYETIFPVDIARGARDRIEIRRGFAVEPGNYKVVVVLRGPEAAKGERRTAILEKQLEVPSFWTGELATSTIILADRIEALPDPVPPAELDEDPYAVGSHRIHPSRGAVYNRRQELIVVFLVYNPAVGPDKHFDVQVDYHLFRKNRSGDVSPAGGRGETQGARPGEVYVTRTNPQRFTPSMMGPGFDPAGGAPVLAGQAILLADFEAGEYRLNIVVTDLFGRRTLSRDVSFSVVGS